MNRQRVKEKVKELERERKKRGRDVEQMRVNAVEKSNTKKQIRGKEKVMSWEREKR